MARYKVMARPLPWHPNHRRQPHQQQNQTLRQSDRSGTQACRSPIAPPIRLGAYHQRLCARMDKAKAVTASAHKLARLVRTR